ncbi:MAG: outer membrane beta-barrel protein [Bacteroidetes bacterium]|nr:outer membrane beta-barrel protein [Bacteroidota bacterium]
MKKQIFLFVLILLISSIAMAQYEKGSWMFSGSGYANFGGLKVETKIPNIQGDDDRNWILGDIIVSTRNAYFPVKNLAVGLDLQLDIEGKGWEPEGDNKANYDKDYKEGTGATNIFVGPIIRYYIPLGKVVALYPEASLGFRNYSHLMYAEGKQVFMPGGSEETYEQRILTVASGFGYNMGAGIAFRLSEHFALDVTTRWGGGKIKGKTKDDSSYPSSANYQKFPEMDTDIAFATIDVLIGFQIYIGGK